MTAFPSFLGFSTNQQVQTTTAGSSTGTITDFDGTSSLAGVSDGNTVPVSALYFGINVRPAFSAATVRKH